MNLELSIGEERLKDILHSLINECCIIHWAEIETPDGKMDIDKLYYDLKTNGIKFLTFSENDETEELFLTVDKLKTGLEKMWMDGELCDNVVKFLSDDELDPEVVDCIVQVSLLGEFKYES